MPEFRQGTYKPNNLSKYKGRGLPKFRSGYELKFFKWCDRNPNVLEWSSESVIVPYISPIDGRVHRYFVDNQIILKEGDKIGKYLIEIKPFIQTQPPKIAPDSRKKRSTIIYETRQYMQNTAKWEAAKKFGERKGFKFTILTERELNIH